MQFRDLPPEILSLLHKLNAPPRLVAHLTVVHDLAITLTQRLAELWPDLTYDTQAVLIGAASHDIGKVVHRQELSGPGHLHEESGPALLLANGIPEAYARFACTHARWQQEQPGPLLEDLLVAFTDKIWRGARDEALETAIAQRIASILHAEVWNVYMQFEDLASDLARDSHTRLVWQGKHAL